MFNAIPVTKNGGICYYRVHLRTKDDQVARRRLIAPDGFMERDDLSGETRERHRRT